MEGRFDQLTDGQLLAVIGDALDALNDGRLRVPTDAEQLALVRQAIRLGGRLQAWTQQAAAQAEASEAAWNEHRTSTTTWLVGSLNLTPREARRLVRSGAQLNRFRVVGAATAAGTVLPGQADAITSVLDELPDDFCADTIGRGEQLMVDLACSHNAAELRHLTSHLLEVLAPETADALDARRLERQERAARARRFLEFRGDGEGSVLIRGSLPVAAAEPFIRIIDAYAAAEKRTALELRDPLAELVTPGMRRADALVALTARHAQDALAPSEGGDRPRVVITLSWDKLVQQCVDAGLGVVDQTGRLVSPGVGGRLTESGEPLAPSTVRQLLCDAEILPVVLGGRSQVLDVGRASRLATPELRAALALRDGGCVFPGCNAPPRACHAHHILPWWAGGRTSLANLVLVCPHHHGIVEPGHDPTADRWGVRIAGDGMAEIIPPRRVDPARQPRRHARLVTLS